MSFAVTLYESSGNVQSKSYSRKVKMELEKPKVELDISNKVKVTEDFTPKVKVTDPNNMKGEISPQWMINEVVVDDDGTERRIPLQIYRNGSIVFLQNKCSLEPKAVKKDLLYECPLTPGDLLAERTIEICFIMTRQNQTVSQCRIIETTDKEPPEVRLSVNTDQGGDSPSLIATCIMCYSGNLHGKISIDEGDGEESGSSKTTQTAIKNGGQTCLSFGLQYANVTEGATYDMSCEVEIQQTEEEAKTNPLPPDIKTVTQDLQLTIPFSPSLTGCDVSCTDCVALTTVTIDITASDESDDLRYHADVVCQKGKNEQRIAIARSSLESFLEAKLPPSIAGLPCHIECMAENRHKLKRTLKSKNINVIKTQGKVSAQELKMAMEDEELRWSAAAYSVSTMNNSAREDVLGSIQDRFIATVTELENLPEEAEDALAEMNRAMEVLGRRNASQNMDDTVRQSFQNAARTVTKDFERKKDEEGENEGQEEGDRRRRKRAAPTSSEEGSGKTLTAKQAETILNGWHNSFANIEEDEIPKVQAQKFIQDFETTISAGLCRGTTLNSPLIEVVTDFVTMNTKWLSFTNISNVALNMSCSNCSDRHQRCSRCPHNTTATVKLNKTIEAKYSQWNCKQGFQCQGACVVSAHIKKDVVSASSNYTVAKTTRWSNIVSLFLINPATEDHINVTLMSNESRIAMAIPIYGDTHGYMPVCKQWKNFTWCGSSCQNGDVIVLNNKKHVVCHCLRAAYTAVFKGPAKEIPLQEQQQSAAAAVDQQSTTKNPFLVNVTPPPAPTTSTQKPSSADGNNSNSGSVNPYPSQNPVANNPPTSLTSIQVGFTLTNNYNEVVSPNKSSFVNSIQTQLAQQIGVNAAQITNLDVKPGSIIVTLILTQTNGSNLNSSLQTLQNKVQTGTLTVLSANGTVLTVDRTSYTVISYNPSAQPTTTVAPGVKKGDESDDKLGLIVGAAVGGGLLLILMIVLAVVCCKKPPKKVNPNSYPSESPRGYENQAYTAPPPSAKPPSPSGEQLYPKLNDNNLTPQDPSRIPSAEELGRPAGRLSPLPRGQLSARPGTPSSSSMPDLG